MAVQQEVAWKLLLPELHFSINHSSKLALVHLDQCPKTNHKWKALETDEMENERKPKYN